jgi:SAM-dependent methyltransferase
VNPSDFDYLERPKQFSRDDFWRQVRRTTHGEPVPQEQIELISAQVASCLALGTSDCLLDIGCGNGALTSLFAGKVKDVLGVDHSDYLVGVAKEFFKSPSMQFQVLGIDALVHTDLYRRANKAVMYGVSHYLSDELLRSAITWYLSVPGNLLFIGPVRDVHKAAAYYGEACSNADLDDHTTSIGKWRDPDWFLELARKLGVDVEIAHMPETYLLSRFSFDVLFRATGQP